MNPGTAQLLLSLIATVNDIVQDIRDNPDIKPNELMQLHANNTVLAQATLQLLDEGIADPNR